MAAIKAAESAVPVTSALFGIATSAFVTPATPVSADCTFLVHPTPHVIPVTSSETVFSSTSAVDGEEVAVSSVFLQATSAKHAQIVVSAKRVVIFFIFVNFNLWAVSKQNRIVI